MKKVLMIAYQYPPMGGPGVQRTSKFVKYLKNFGYEPIVYTITHQGGVLDTTLEEDVEEVQVIRSKAYSIDHLPNPINRVVGKVARKFVIPDLEYIWYKNNRQQLCKIVEEVKPDLIYSTSYPYSDHLMGLYVKKRFPHIPWVVDFRDEWTKNPYIIDMNYSKKRMDREKAMEKAVALKCDAFVANTPFMLDGFTEEYPIKDKAYVISNGYDEDDFEGLSINEEANKQLTFTYSGGMYGRRNPDHFLKGMKVAVEEGLIDGKDIKIQFIGKFNTALIDSVYEKIGYRDMVTFYDYMPHKKSIEFLMNSDILLLIIGNGPGAKNFYTGKLFEYINTGKTILGLVPEDGAAAGVIEATKTGVVVNGDDLEGIKEQIVKLYYSWKVGELTVEPNRQEIEQYSRLALTEKLSDVFNYVLEK